MIKSSSSSSRAPSSASLGNVLGRFSLLGFMVAIMFVLGRESIVLGSILSIMGREEQSLQEVYASMIPFTTPISTATVLPHERSVPAWFAALAFSKQPILNLNPNRVTLGDREVLYQFPPDVGAGAGKCSKGLIGVLFLYHGCARTAASFFYSPQGRDMMKMALSAGLAVVAFEKSQGQLCWSADMDLEPIIKMGNGWIKDHLTPHCAGAEVSAFNVTELPYFGFGASSGGSFVARVAEEAKRTDGFKFDAINVQIMTPRSDITTPTVFTVMSRDERTIQGVEQVSSKLKRRRVPTLVYKTKPKKVSTGHFLIRFRYDHSMTMDIASKLCADLEQMGAISKEDGELIKNPRSLELDDAFFEKYNTNTSRAHGVGDDLWNILNESEKDDASTLWLLEELNVCYDQHEITMERFEDVLAFFFDSA